MTLPVYSKKGFTLVELLVVIVIIGILAGVSIAILRPAIFYGKGRDARRVSDLEAVRGALAQYYLDHGNEYPGESGANTQEYYNALEALLGDYIDSWEQDPLNDPANGFVYNYDPHQVSIAGVNKWKCYQLSTTREVDGTVIETCGGSLTCQAAASFCN